MIHTQSQGIRDLNLIEKSIRGFYSRLIITNLVIVDEHKRLEPNEVSMSLG